MRKRREPVNCTLPQGRRAWSLPRSPLRATSSPRSWFCVTSNLFAQYCHRSEALSARKLWLRSQLQCSHPRPPICRSQQNTYPTLTLAFHPTTLDPPICLPTLLTLLLLRESYPLALQPGLQPCASFLPANNSPTPPKGSIRRLHWSLPGLQRLEISQQTC